MQLSNKHRSLHDHSAYNQLRRNWSITSHSVGTRLKEDIKSAFTCRLSRKWFRAGKIYGKGSEKNPPTQSNLEGRGKRGHGSMDETVGTHVRSPLSVTDYWTFLKSICSVNMENIEAASSKKPAGI